MLLVDPLLSPETLEIWLSDARDLPRNGWVPFNSIHAEVLESHGVHVLAQELAWDVSERQAALSRFADVVEHCEGLKFDVPEGMCGPIPVELAPVLSGMIQLWASLLTYARYLNSVSHEQESVWLISGSDDFLQVANSIFTECTFVYYRLDEGNPKRFAPSKSVLHRLNGGLRALARSRRNGLLLLKHRQTNLLLDSAVDRVPRLEHSAFNLMWKAVASLNARSGTGEVFDFSLADGRVRDLGESLSKEERIAWSVLTSQLTDLRKHTASELRAMALILDLWKPSVIVSVNWQGVTNAFLRGWCKARGSTHATIQHGFQQGARISDRTRKIRSDVFFCWGEWYSDHQIDRSANESVQLLPLGNPAFSAAETEIAPRSEPIEILIAPSAFLVPFQDKWIEFWESVFRVVARRPDISWSLRLHNHSQSRAVILERSRELGVTIRRVSEGPIHEDIRKADIVLTSVSSVVLDGFAGRRPVIVYDLIDEPEYFSSSGACPVFKMEADIFDELDRLRSQPDYYLQRVDAQDGFFRNFRKPDLTRSYLEAFRRLQRGG